MKNNYNFKRFVALCIDLFIVILLTTLLSNIKVLNPKEKEYNKAIESYSEYVQDISNQKVVEVTKDKEYLNLYHDIQKYSISYYIISFVVFVLYYTLFPYFGNDQTAGKRLLKLKYQRDDKKKISIFSYLLRSLILPIISNIVINIPLSYVFYIAIVLLFKGNTYFYVVEILSLIICAYGYIDIVYFISNKEKKTLHDVITKVNVVEC